MSFALYSIFAGRSLSLFHFFRRRFSQGVKLSVFSLPTLRFRRVSEMGAAFFKSLIQEMGSVF
jgi:hypothetical protein